MKTNEAVVYIFIYPSDLLKQWFEYARENKCEKMKLS